MSNTALKSAERRPVIAVTSGEPAGIGPDICLALAAADLAAHIRVLGDRELLQSRAAALGVDIGALAIEHVPLRASCVAGRLDTANALASTISTT